MLFRSGLPASIAGISGCCAARQDGMPTNSSCAERSNAAAPSPKIRTENDSTKVANRIRNPGSMFCIFRVLASPRGEAVSSYTRRWRYALTLTEHVRFDGLRDVPRGESGKNKNTRNGKRCSKKKIGGSNTSPRCGNPASRRESLEKVTSGSRVFSTNVLNVPLSCANCR